MLKNCIGVDVLTTFTDVDSIDLSETASTTSNNNLEEAERTAYNSMGVSRNIFNTDGNLSLEKSILDDESSMRSLLFQFNIFMDRIVARKNLNAKKYNFKFYFLETTQYNYQNLAKVYKEQTQLGFSKMLP
nr:MAG TPA: portal protein [Caudoviricetes sp.]